MAENSKIEWTDHTQNFWVGCTKISPACDFCYAETWAKRAGSPELWQGERRRTKTWAEPYKWNKAAKAAGKRAKVFANSLSDFFDNQAPDEWRRDAWEVIWGTSHLDWLLLTKRPQNIADMLPCGPEEFGQRWTNVWLGTTVENQDEADRRIPHLLAVPAAVRFLSCEPLLGPLDLYNGDPDPRLGGHRASKTFLGDWWEPGDDPKAPSRHGVDWVIAGGESGGQARPSHPDWFRSLRDQCAVAEVPFLFKQWGEHAPNWLNDDAGEKIADSEWIDRMGKKAAGRILDGCIHDEFPAGAQHA